jgi:hypothetical protein
MPPQPDQKPDDPNCRVGLATVVDAQRFVVDSGYELGVSLADERRVVHVQRRPELLRHRRDRLARKLGKDRREDRSVGNHPGLSGKAFERADTAKTASPEYRAYPKTGKSLSM